MASRARHLHSSATHLKISVDRLFDAAFGSSAAIYRRESLMGWRPVATTGPTLPDSDANRYPPLEDDTPDNPSGIHIYETADRIIVEVEIPEIKADSLYLEISGDLLIIRGERRMEAHVSGSGGRLASKGPLVHRYVQLPIIARPGEVRARLEGNTVKVKISKRAKLD